jgi:hypothetical protein
MIIVIIWILIMKRLDDDTKRFIGRMLRYAAEILILIASFFGVSELLSSCGSATTATVKYIEPGTSVSVSITTNNPSEINVSPNDNLNYKKNE